MRNVLLSSLVIAWSSACYSWEAVKPTELPKLNSGGVAAGRVVSGTQTGEVVAVSVAHLERPDGTLLEVTGSADVRITDTSGAEVEFDHPTESVVTGTDLLIRGENRANTKFALGGIDSADVSQYDGVKSMLVYLGALAATIGVTALIVME